jgi:site-specific DNA recombinase
LLAYLKDSNDIDYVIVYMRSRAFRDSTDAGITKRALSLLGIRIVSCKEDFGQGPVADAMETVSDAFNELQVRQNGEDIKAKLRHKALNGGTISRAKVGYLNIRADFEGRLFNSIGLDPVRAPLIRQAWELYSTGEYSIDLLHITMADLGLTNRPTHRWPREQAVSANKLHQMLSDPYYAGWVTVDGRLIRGQHEAIVSQDLFDRVQDVLDTRSRRGQRDRILTHYLKGTMFCDRCDKAGRTSRLIYTEAKGRNGEYYGYYLCRGRQQGFCDLPHLPVGLVEDAITRNYRTLRVPDGFAAEIEQLLETTMADQLQLTREVHESLAKQLGKLDVREERLIDLAADGVLSRTKIQQRSNAIQLERRRIQSSMADTTAELALGAERLRSCLKLVTEPADMYEHAPDPGRRQLNRTFYQRFYLDDLKSQAQITVTKYVLNPPFEEIRNASQTYLVRRDAPKDLSRVTTDKFPDLTAGESENYRTLLLADIFSVSGSSNRVLVELRGLEPLTPSLRTRCATSCATAPWCGRNFNTAARRVRNDRNRRCPRSSSHRPNEQRFLVGWCDFTVVSTTRTTRYIRWRDLRWRCDVSGASGAATFHKLVELAVVNHAVKGQHAGRPWPGGLDRHGHGIHGLCLEGVCGRRHRNGCPAQQVGLSRRLDRLGDLGRSSHRRHDHRLRLGLVLEVGRTPGVGMSSTCGRSTRLRICATGDTFGHRHATQPRYVGEQGGNNARDAPPRQDGQGGQR